MSKLPDLTNACKPLSDIFASAQEREEQRKAAVAKKIIDIEIDLIDDFPDHPFHVRDDEDMMQLVESIREHGIMTPATVTRKAGNRYEMVSGHRRKHAAEIAGLTAIPCEIVELSHDDAVLRMVESNFQRSEIMPSEKAFAYKMRLEVLKRKAGRNSESKPPVERVVQTADNLQLCRIQRTAWTTLLPYARACQSRGAMPAYRCRAKYEEDSDHPPQAGSPCLRKILRPPSTSHIRNKARIFAGFVRNLNHPLNGWFEQAL